MDLIEITYTLYFSDKTARGTEKKQAGSNMENLIEI